ncbi:MAG: hypothetical protein KDA42_13895, partial [Planctomycetales bacterium]|nr:hypothetical protein [Planctomycetales bacterium]
MITTYALMILAAAAAVPQDQRHPDAVEVYHCALDAQSDLNYDRWPDGWQRKEGPGFPHYLKIGIHDEPTAVAGSCLRIEPDGGAAAIHSPPIQVDNRFSYVLECRVRSAGLTHDSARVTVTFYDADKNVVEEYTSDAYRNDAEWTKIHIGPFNTSSELAEMAVIGLHLEPGEREDLAGWVEFDDIWFARLPRMTLTTNSEFNVYSSPNDVRVTCHISGIVERDPEIRFELLDASSQSIDQSAQILQGEVIARKSSKVSEILSGAANTPVGYAGTAEWKPQLVQDSADNAYGFYRVRVTMRSQQGIMHERETTIAIIRPLSEGVRGGFGWSLPRGDDPLSLEALSSLLPTVGINWLKFPVWYDDVQSRRGEEIMRFAERLTLKDIELIGVLDNPPERMRAGFGDQTHMSAANIFSSDSTLWLPSLDPVMTRLSMKIRWWQLGADHDTSFVGYPKLPEKIDEIRRKLYRFGQEVHLGLPWRWLAETHPEENPPWQFLTYSATPSLTADELSVYLAG